MPYQIVMELPERLLMPTVPVVDPFSPAQKTRKEFKEKKIEEDQRFRRVQDADQQIDHIIDQNLKAFEGPLQALTNLHMAEDPEDQELENRDQKDALQNVLNKIEEDQKRKEMASKNSGEADLDRATVLKAAALEAGNVEMFEDLNLHSDLFVEQLTKMQIEQLNRQRELPATGMMSEASSMVEGDIHRELSIKRKEAVKIVPFWDELDDSEVQREELNEAHKLTKR